MPGPGINPTIDTIYPSERDEVSAAMTRVTSSTSRGKLVVAISADEEVA